MRVGETRQEAPPANIHGPSGSLVPSNRNSHPRWWNKPAPAQFSSVHEERGWGTSDSEQAFAMMKRFGSVTVLNGHIHQVMQKVEGQVMFHTAMSTAFPQPAPGAAPSPGPMKVSADRLRACSVLRT
jgi:hypothetical protein